MQRHGLTRPRVGAGVDPGLPWRQLERALMSGNSGRSNVIQRAFSLQYDLPAGSTSRSGPATKTPSRATPHVEGYHPPGNEGVRTPSAERMCLDWFLHCLDRDHAMATTSSFRRTTAGALLVGLSASASALSFNFSFLPTSSAQDIAGFTAAGNIWSGLLSDAVTINMTVGTDSLNPGVLAQAGSTQATYSYSSFRSALAADATSATDTTAVGTLSLGSTFDMLINRTSNNPNGSGSATAYLDNDGDANNSTVRLTNANAKAVGLMGASAAEDAKITFGNAFTWDYDPSNGITAGAYDFIGIAVHEIGHALGFISGVDILDINSPPVNGPFADNQFTFVSALDLFRYSAASTALGVIDWTASTTAKYFSLDNGASAIAGFSTGKNFGDGRQASHWKDNLGLGVMDPTAGTGELLAISGNDLMAFDTIGWNLAPIPEPSTYALFATGLLGLGWAKRRSIGRG